MIAKDTITIFVDVFSGELILSYGHIKRVSLMKVSEGIGMQGVL